MTVFSCATWLTAAPCVPSLRRNGINVEGATHKQVVEHIKSGGDSLTLTVISVSAQVRPDSGHTTATRASHWL